MADTAMKGMLMKFASILRGYQPRYFDLDSENGLLKYSLDEPRFSFYSPRGFMHLAMAKVSTEYPEKEPLQFYFKVKPAFGQTYRLRASSFQERQEWMTAIQGAIDKATEKLQQGQRKISKIIQHGVPLDTGEIVKKSKELKTPDGKPKIPPKPSPKPPPKPPRAHPEIEHSEPEIERQEPCKRVVAGIDFGTTFSGYAFSSKEEFEKDPLKIYTTERWKSKSPVTLLSHKVPTVLLLNQNGEFAAFGYEAEEKYLDLANEEAHHGWRYFKHFKMQLYKNMHLNRNMTLKDDQGQEMEAMDVFAMCIEYLKDHLYRMARHQTPDLKEEEIFFVLTIPAIWNDMAREFMRKAAMMAGIHANQLTLALEPEAAAVLCKNIELTKRQTEGGPTEFGAFEPGTQFMVVDLGGGTIDITVLEVTEKNTLRELQNASGGPFGGKCVDEQFIIFLKEIFGASAFDTFREECQDDFLEMLRNFEVKKRMQDLPAGSKVTIEIPTALVQETEKQSGMNLKQSLSQPHPKYVSMGGIQYLAGKIRVPEAIIRQLFKPSIDGILAEMRKLFSEPPVSEVNTVLLVGGFSDSRLIREAVEKEFQGKKFIYPGDGELSVVKGAVIFGHRMDIISNRLSPYHYGVEVMEPFDPKQHPAEKKFTNAKGDFCKEIFQTVLEKGTEIEIGVEMVDQVVRPSVQGDGSLRIFLYGSTQANPPKFITDKGCLKLCSINVHIPPWKQSEDRDFTLRISFDATEMKVVVTDNASLRCYVANTHFLQRQSA